MDKQRGGEIMKSICSGKMSKNREAHCFVCGKKATHWFIKKTLLTHSEMNYCEECLRERYNKLGLDIDG